MISRVLIKDVTDEFGNHEPTAAPAITQHKGCIDEQNSGQKSRRRKKENLLSGAIWVVWKHSALAAPELHWIEFQNKLRKVQSYISEFRGQLSD